MHEYCIAIIIVLCLVAIYFCLKCHHEGFFNRPFWIDPGQTINRNYQGGTISIVQQINGNLCIRINPRAGTSYYWCSGLISGDNQRVVTLWNSQNKKIDQYIPEISQNPVHTYDFSFIAVKMLEARNMRNTENMRNILVHILEQV